MLLSIIPVSAAETQDVSVIGGCKTIDGQVPLLGTGQLISNAAAVLLYEVNTDTLMYAYNADNQVTPSSLVKILTALIAVEKGKMDDVVTVRSEVLSTLAPDAAMVGLEIDEVLTVKDLLYCMMVASGNDAAVILADHVMGSQQKFVEEMNRFAAEIGCTGTHFTNVHGLHDENQYTTARDVGRILIRALQNESFCEVFGAKSYVVPKTNKSEERKLTTQNYLMNSGKAIYDERLTGGRTAVNNDQTRSIASVAQVNDMHLMCVVIGARSQFEKDGYTVKVFGGYSETQELLDMGFNGYKTAQILQPDQVLQQISVMGGDCDVSMGTGKGALCVIPVGTDLNGLSFRYANEISLTAPLQKGQKLSDLQVFYGSVCLAQTETYAMNAVRIAGTQFTDNVQNAEKPGFFKVFFYVLGSVFLLVLAIFGCIQVTL